LVTRRLGKAEDGSHDALRTRQSIDFATDGAPAGLFREKFCFSPGDRAVPLVRLGRTPVCRFHLHDPVYFDQSLRFTIEHGHANGLALELASVAYWYQDQAAAVEPTVARAAHQPRENVSARDIFRWGDEWRKARGNSPTLWGSGK
jgi:hypothetical protein